MNRHTPGTNTSPSTAIESADLGTLRVGLKRMLLAFVAETSVSAANEGRTPDKRSAMKASAAELGAAAKREKSGANSSAELSGALAANAAACETTARSLNSVRAGARGGSRPGPPHMVPHARPGAPRPGRLLLQIAERSSSSRARTSISSSSSTTRKAARDALPVWLYSLP